MVISEAVEVVDAITVKVVETAQIDVRKLYTQDYPTAHIDLAILVVQSHYQTYIDNIIAIFKKEHPGEDVPKMHRDIKERALLYSHINAHQYLINHAHDVIDRSTVWLLDIAERTGSFRSDFFNWDTLLEMLSHTADGLETGGGSAYQWNSIVTELLPAARQFDIDPALFLAATGAVGKLQDTVPAYHELKERMQAKQISLEEGADALKWMLSMAADPKTSRPLLNEKLKRWRGIQSEKIPEIPGWVILVPIHDVEGDHLEEVFVIPTNGDRITGKMIKGGLRNRVLFTDLGIEAGIKLLTGLMRAHGKELLDEDKTEEDG